MKEIYKDVGLIGFDGLYKVSNLGRVYSKRSKKILKLSLNKVNGYFSISLYNKGKVINKTAHRLVALAFISNPLLKTQVNHKDSNRTNNKLSNLEWVSPSENMQHASKAGSFKERCGEIMSTKLKEYQVLEIRKMFVPNTAGKRNANGNYKEICLKYKISSHSLSAIINRRTWKSV